MASKADSAIVYEYHKNSEAPGSMEQCGGSWHFFLADRPQARGAAHPSLTLTETQWVALGKPERLTATIENADD